MQTFETASNSAFKYSLDFKQKRQNGDVSCVGGMQTSAEIIDSVPLSDSELAQLVVLFWFVVSTCQSFLQVVQCHMEANTSQW